MSNLGNINLKPSMYTSEEKAEEHLYTSTLVISDIIYKEKFNSNIENIKEYVINEMGWNLEDYDLMQINPKTDWAYYQFFLRPKIDTEA